MSATAEASPRGLKWRDLAASARSVARRSGFHRGTDEARRARAMWAARGPKLVCGPSRVQSLARGGARLGTSRSVVAAVAQSRCRGDAPGPVAERGRRSRRFAPMSSLSRDPRAPGRLTRGRPRGGGIPSRLSSRRAHRQRQRRSRRRIRRSTAASRSPVRRSRLSSRPRAVRVRTDASAGVVALATPRTPPRSGVAGRRPRALGGRRSTAAIAPRARVGADADGRP